MLIFTKIPTDRLPEVLAIEARSNPYPWSEKNLIDSYKTYRHLGLFLNERLIALVIYQLVVDEGEIIHLVCDRQMQGKGHAYQLMNHLIKHNQTKHHIHTWHLEVRANNDKAIQLYQHLGFIEIGRRKAYYQQKEDAILMCLTISKTNG